MASATKTVQKHFKQFCSYCHAKGLPESVFTSHFVKDKPGKGGKVCCPELLKNECGYCHEVGHTPRFCPKLKARDARRAAAAKRTKMPKTFARNADGKAPTLMPTKDIFAGVTGYFTPKNQVKEAFPALPSAPKKAPRPTNAAVGIWGAAHTLSVAQLEQLLSAKRAVAPQPTSARLTNAQLTSAEQAFIDAQLDKQSQSLEETAAGEAFYDNVADAEDAAEAIADTEQPTLVRQGAFGGGFGGVSATLPEPMPGIALPACCDLAADFGDEPSGDGWGSDCDE